VVDQLPQHDRLSSKAQLDRLVPHCLEGEGEVVRDVVVEQSDHVVDADTCALDDGVAAAYTRMTGDVAVCCGACSRSVQQR